MSKTSKDLCLGYSLSQLLEILFEINIPVEHYINPIADSLESINLDLNNHVEIACLYERMF